MRPTHDSNLTLDARCSEVAAILAAGVLRFSARTLSAIDAGDHSSPENPADSASLCLEVTVLSVHNG